MARVQRLGLTAVRSEGAILPPSVLQRVHAEDPTLEGMTPEAFGLSGERLREAASRAWNALQAPWRTFQTERAKLASQDTGTGITRSRWLLQILKALDYGALDPLKESLKVGEREYPVSHLYGNAPLHLVGCNLDLDRKTPGAVGAARMTPHGLVQLLLNAGDDYVWGFVSNGLRWRILRDDNSLSRQSMVEFDLEAIFEGQLYDAFRLFYLLCHQSRVKSERPEECRLEQWSQAAKNDGKRALDTLRNGVEKAIETLGQGFLKHPANNALRQSLRDGTLDKQGYYRQLLRLVYRLLFLFVAEDRNLLLLPDTPAESRELYTEYYSTQRLRLLAERLRGSARHHDLFQQLRLILEKLGEEDGCPELGLPALGGFLFSDQACPDLNPSQLSNADLLEALRCLAVTQEGGRRTRVDYKNLASEEMGSVYESLLELHPDLSSDGTRFELRSAGGNERKTTGSYYTPDSLIQCLLDTALDPVVEEAVRTARPRFTAKDGEPPEAQAILALKVIDPAVGSGHFLIAAAHRLAKRLAQARTGDEEPAPAATRRAVRDVIGHCLYGIDVNPMSAELCKVALWMESLEPGRPLTFLEHHIQVGNSLLGATPELIAGGIPDDAYTAIEGDDKAVCAALKRQNRSERQGQGSLFAPEVFAGGSLLAAWQRLEGMSDDTFKNVQEKTHRYREARAALGTRQRLADAWCAVFVVPKTPATTSDFRGITTGSLRTLAAGKDLDAPTTRAIEEAAARFGFLHPHLAFPSVFATGGFDVVLGNPPWDTLSPDAKEFFSQWDVNVRFQSPDEQQATIDRLRVDPSIGRAWEEHCRALYHSVAFMKNSGRYRLFAPGNLGKGDFNVYRMFVETALAIVRPGGRASQVVPEGLYNGANCMKIREELFDRCALQSIYGFENHRHAWFDSVDTRAKFSIYLAQVPGHTERFRVAFNIRSQAELASVTKEGAFELPVSLVREFSPEALALMELGSQCDIDIATKMYAAHPKFGDDSAVRPYRRYMTELHMGNDRDLFSEAPGGVPVYEGRMVAAFDHRAKGYRSGRGRKADWEDLAFSDPNKAILPQWLVATDKIPEKVRERYLQYRIGFCDVASPTNERTLVATIIPQGVLCGHKVPTITFESGGSWSYAVWVAVANALTMDFLARKKVSLSMSYTVLDSLPFPRLSKDDPRAKYLVTRVARLVCTGPEMVGYWNDLASEGWVEPHPDTSELPGECDEQRRRVLTAELDAFVAKELFGLTRKEVEYVLDTFPIIEKRDRKTYGEYRTKSLILEVFDALQPACWVGMSYQAQVNPPSSNDWVPPPLEANGEWGIANGDGGRADGGMDAGGTPLPGEPDELLLTPPTPKPLRDKDGQEMRVRVYSASEEVLLKRGLVMGRRKNGECTVWSIIADGETVPREFQSPPCVVKRLKSKVI